MFHYLVIGGGSAGCVLAASILWSALHDTMSLHELLIALFLLLTAPVAAHLLARAALAQAPSAPPPAPAATAPIAAERDGS